MKKSKKILIILLIVVCICIYLIAFLRYSNNNKKVINKNYEKKVQQSNEISFVAAGDCLIHRFVYTDALNQDGSYSFSKMFTEVEPLIKNHDLAYYNQESNIGGIELKLSAYPLFNSPIEIGKDMVNLGFNMVSLANNHTMDRGEKGVINSINFWNTYPGVYHSGQALSEEERLNNIKVKEKNGIKYAFISYTTVTNGLFPEKGKEYLTNIYSLEKARNDINIIKDKVDMIIIAMHWGEEYTTTPSIGQKQIAKDLSDLGVNLIIGNHPHSIQPIEMINDTLVIYALGNFISAQDTPDRLTGTIIDFKIKKEGNKIMFSNIKANLIYTYFKGSRDFKIYPYAKLDNTILNNYETYYNKYKGVLTKYSNLVEVE